MPLGQRIWKLRLLRRAKWNTRGNKMSIYADESEAAAYVTVFEQPTYLIGMVTVMRWHTLRRVLWDECVSHWQQYGCEKGDFHLN